MPTTTYGGVASYRIICKKLRRIRRWQPLVTCSKVVTTHQNSNMWASIIVSNELGSMGLKGSCFTCGLFFWLFCQWEGPPLCWLLCEKRGNCWWKTLRKRVLGAYNVFTLNLKEAKSSQRHCMSIVLCPRTQHNQGSDLDHLIKVPLPTS